MCDLRWCNTGEPGTVRVIENIGDGAWTVEICHDCATRLQLRENDELPEATEVQRVLEQATYFECGPCDKCPDGSEHDYSGYESFAGGETAVCAKCGHRAIDDALWF